MAELSSKWHSCTDRRENDILLRGLWLWKPFSVKVKAELKYFLYQFPF